MDALRFDIDIKTSPSVPQKSALESIGVPIARECDPSHRGCLGSDKEVRLLGRNPNPAGWFSNYHIRRRESTGCSATMKSSKTSAKHIAYASETPVPNFATKARLGIEKCGQERIDGPHA
jgi:hypothetical protein